MGDAHTEPAKSRVRVSPAPAPAGVCTPTAGLEEARLKEKVKKFAQVGFV